MSTAAFTTSRKGFDQAEVRDFLRMVAAELARLQEREKFLERELRSAQRGTTNASVALDEEVVTRLLGEEAARILSTAREAASQIKVKAEDNAARLLREATDEAQRLREEAEVEAARRRHDAAADAEAELQMAKQQGRDMVNEARAYRERVLNELARRREMARQQIEQLVHGRDRLLQAFERARLAAVDVMAEMTPLSEPNEYVNLTPTTGPVPLMVPAGELRGRAAEQQEPADAETAEADTDAADEHADVALYDQQELEDGESLDDVDATEPELDELVDDVAAETELDTPDEIEPADVEAEPIEEERIAPVVSLFGDTPPVEPSSDTATDTAAEPAGDAVSSIETSPAADDEPAAPAGRGSVDDLFAKLRAARAETVVERATTTAEVVDPAPEAAAPPAEAASDETVDLSRIPLPDSTEELSVFQATPEAPAEEVEYEDTAFGRRDAALTPLIVAAARKLKRVLADEQNDVLHALRSSKTAVTLETLLPPQDEQLRRYADAIQAELTSAALAGADSIDEGSKKEHTKSIAKGHALAPAVDAIGTTIVQPLRERLERAVADADGDRDDLVGVVRAVYREWKNTRIDEHLDDVALIAFGRGALVALAPGTPICWTVDPNGPDCPDAEDNALAGVVAAGDPFPTDHVCAPAHEGCRCMLQQVPR